MPANAQPIFTRAPAISWTTAAITTANTAKDGTGTVVTVFTADATNGGLVRSLRCKPAGSNVASVLRVFINNGSTTATAANNVLFADMSLPLITNTEVAAQSDIEIPLNLALPAGYTLTLTIGTTVASGWYVCAIGGKF